GMGLRVTVELDGELVLGDTFGLQSSLVERRLPLVARGEVPETAHLTDRPQPALWSPEHPNLYDLGLELVGAGGETLDAVESYFGMRKVETREGKVYLNGSPYYQRLVLDQGYFPGGILTAPTDEDLRRDVELTKELGFNGARKHQKVEDPRWLFWADTLGLLVWGEMANAYQYGPEYVRRITAEWQEAVRRDYNHPSIVAWAPMNESWGVPNLAGDQDQIEHLLALYHLTRSLDQTRPVVSNDGWEHALTDLCNIHDYRDAEALASTYVTPETSVAATPADRPVYVRGYGYRGEPILVTEFGGIAFSSDGDRGWGYSTVADADEFLARYEALIAALLQSEPVQGFCYTQLTDVEQEVNGLLSYDRRPKADTSLIKEITARPRP
ncbi:MAG: glycoside hydrolase family 2 protein, partial [Rubrobacter sp.]